MALWDFGNPPVSNGTAPTTAGSTTFLYAELDSTVLGTKDLIANQKLLAKVNWIMGADTNVTWQCETTASTALNAGVDIFYTKTPTAQSGQYATMVQLFKDYRIRIRQASSGANGHGYLQAEIVT